MGRSILSSGTQQDSIHFVVFHREVGRGASPFDGHRMPGLVGHSKPSSSFRPRQGCTKLAFGSLPVVQVKAPRSEVQVKQRERLAFSGQVIRDIRAEFKLVSLSPS